MSSEADRVITEIKSTRASDWNYGPMEKHHAMILVNEIGRLRVALRKALEKASACAPADRLHELEPLWSVLEHGVD